MRARYQYARLFWLLLLGCPPLLQARPVDPYVAQVPVSDSSPESIAQAYTDALIQVLNKATGAPDQVAALAADLRLGPADALVMQHGFVQSALLDDSSQRMLQVRFSPAQVNELRDTLQLPFWPLERPETIAWIALQKDGERRLLGLAAADEPELARLAAAGDHHGVPLVLPLLDLDDQRAVRPADVWGGFVDVVERASLRYGAVQVLLGRAFPDSGGWSVRWTLTGADYTDGWSSRAQSLATALQAGVGEMARRMGYRFSLQATSVDQRTLVLRLRGVGSADDYGRAMAYLRALSVISRVDLQQAQGETVDIQVTTATGLRGLMQVFRTGGQVLISNDRRPPGVDLVVEIGR